MASLTYLVLFFFSFLTPSILSSPVATMPGTILAEVLPRSPQTSTGIQPFKSTADLLRYFYKDMTRLSEVADPAIVLHRWDDPKQSNNVVGRPAVQAHLEGFIAATDGTLFMDFKEVSANEHFGSVMGMLRVGKPGGTVGNAQGQVSVPFCGVWRFKNGRPVEHWENVGEGAEKLARWMQLAVGA